MATTLKDLGKRAGVSHTTVARVLKGYRNVSESVRERVANAARELNYAKVDRFDAKKSVLICVTNVHIPLCSSIIQGAEDFLHRAGYSVIIQSIGAEGRKASDIVPYFQNRGIGGVILQTGAWYVNSNLDWLVDAVGANFPVVQVDCKLPYINTSHIVSDNFGGAVRLVRELVDQSCKRIAFLGIGEKELSSVKERLEGYRAALRCAGIPFDEDLMLMCDGDEDWASNPKLLSWINGKTQVDAIFTLNDMVFEWLVQKCMVENRIFLDKCSFATFDYPMRGFYYPMDIVVAAQNTYRMGFDAAQVVVELCEDKKNCPRIQQSVLDVEIVKNVKSLLNVSAQKAELAPQQV